MAANEEAPGFGPGEVYWAGSDEWAPWTSRPAVRVIEKVPSSSGRLLRVEALTEPPEEFLFDVPFYTELVRSGGPVGALVFKSEPRLPWDGTRPLTRNDLEYQGEAVLSRRREELPFVPPEVQERRRKGWTW